MVRSGKGKGLLEEPRTMIAFEVKHGSSNKGERERCKNQTKKNNNMV